MFEDVGGEKPKRRKYVPIDCCDMCCYFDPDDDYDFEECRGGSCGLTHLTISDGTGKIPEECPLPNIPPGMDH